MATSSPRRSGLAIGGRCGEPHPTVMRTPAAQPRRAERLCQDRVLAGSDTHPFPASPPFTKATGSLPEGSVPFGTAGDWGGSSGRWLLLSRRLRRDGGREDLGWLKAKPVFLGPRYAEPVCSPDPPTRRTPFCDHRGRNSRTRPASLQSVWLPGLLPDPSGGVDAPLLGGVVGGVSPSRLPLGFGSPATP